jgi:leader peptidase (prepilin peptidase) / N-methyltransferase
MQAFAFLNDPSYRPLIQVYLFLAGAVIGSFLNVCIHRIPLQKSVVTPRSGCPRCGAGIPWYHNIPILSYLWLRGRCRNCKQPISLSYPLVELLTAVLYVLLFRYFGISVSFFIYAFFASLVIILVFTDYNHRLLPHVITFPGIVIGLVLSFFNPLIRPVDSVMGVLIGGVIPLLTLLLYKWVRKKEGLGHGDIVMLAMVGAFLGWHQVLLVLFFSSLVGSLIGGLLILFFRRRSDYMLPFGTFIGMAALAAIFWGPRLWNLYFSR